MDILFILIINLAVIIAAFFLGEKIRIILGIPYVLLIPGYALLAALFIRKNALPIIERFTLSLGLSLVIVPLIGIILNYTTWGIRFIPVIICLTFFVVVASLVAIFRRHQLSWNIRFDPEFHLKLPNINIFNKPISIVNLIIAILIIITAGLFLYGVTNVKQGEKYSEFYILGKGFQAAEYPKQLVLGDQVEVILGIINKEQQETSYSVEIRINGVEVGKIIPIMIKPEERWEQTAIFTPLILGENQRVDFLLFKSGTTQPYRTLNIWIDVKPAEQDN